MMYQPDINENPNAIYIDFEGVPEEGWIYLLGGIIIQEGKPNEPFSYWADNKDQEKAIFKNLFALLEEFQDTPIYHYGSYENKALKQVVRKYPAMKQELGRVEKRMVNLFAYLRTHVYPPTYSNGLKELAAFLGFKWTEEKADGLQSLVWRKQWEIAKENSWKEKLLQYNQDDCKALIKVNQWLQQLATTIGAAGGGNEEAKPL